MTSATGASLEPYVRDALRAAGAPARAAAPLRLTDTTVGPGQLNQHFRVDVDGAAYLCKVSRRGGLAAFRGEQMALRMLADAAPDDLRVAPALAAGTIDSGVRAYALFPWLHLAPFGSSIPSVQRALGRGLAHVHQHSCDRMHAHHQGRFGFPVPTWLGAIEQDNTWSAAGEWTTFFVERRLRPRLTAALSRYGESYGTSNEAVLALSTLGERVCSADAMRYFFEGVDVRPCLIHGDLFMGNCGATAGDRVACMYDAASYFAHDEMDLVLSTLWGSFGDEFYSAYHEVRGPPKPRFHARQQLYRLYYLLSMLVIHGPGFGSNGSVENPNGYFERCVETLTRLNNMISEGA